MSRFVSGGTNDQPTERDDAWLTAQSELDARHLQKIEASKQQDGKSLFETLQANKAAKQDAFDEAARLSNQFRSLDDDEVEFLDSVAESARRKEIQVKKQTIAQLDAFRLQQEEAEKLVKQQDSTNNPPELSETWAVGGLKKRKKGRDREVIPGVKAKRVARPAHIGLDGVQPEASTEIKPLHSGESSQPKTDAVQPIQHVESCADTEQHQKPPLPTKSTSSPTLTLGLAAYSSDEDD